MDSIVDAARQRDEYERRIRADERRAIRREVKRRLRSEEFAAVFFKADDFLGILDSRDARAKKEAGR